MQHYTRSASKPNVYGELGYSYSAAFRIDHAHLLVNYPPKVELSKLVNSLKGVSSRMLRKEHPDIVSRYWKNVLWSRSYFAASCGGAPIGIIKQYIEQQRTPH